MCLHPWLVPILHQNWRKRKGSKEKDDGIGSRETRCLIEGYPCLVAFVYESDNNVVSQRLVEKFQLPTSFHPNQASIKFSRGQCVEEILCDITPKNSVMLFWDGHGWILKHSILMNVPFIWRMRDMKWSRNLWQQRQASKDQHRLKEKIEKQRTEKEEI